MSYYAYMPNLYLVERNTGTLVDFERTTPREEAIRYYAATNVE